MKNHRLLATAVVLLGVGVVGFGVATTPAAAEEETGWRGEFHVTIAPDGTVESAETVVTIDRASYRRLEAEATQQGFDSVAAAFASQVVANEPQYGGYQNAEDERVGDRYRLSWEYTNIDIAKSDKTELTVDDGTVKLLVGDVDDPATDERYSKVTYRVQMPGEITSTNAYETDGTTAIWRLHRESVNVLSAESETTGGDGTETTAEDEDEDDTATSSGVGVGFGPAVALVSLLVVTAGLRRR